MFARSTRPLQCLDTSKQRADTHVPATFRAISILLVAAASLPAVTRYPVTGIVLEVDVPHRSFVASCAAIPGYMEAMAMPYSVLDSKQLADLKPGAYVDFTLVVEKKRSYADGIRIHHYDASEREPLLARRLKLMQTPRAILQPGDAVPDFTLTDQTGRRIALSQLAGKVVAVTFIYTSCPLPDYCFRLSNNLGQLNQRFATRMGRDLVLLSISFDPEYDKPKVLREYGARYAGELDPHFTHWQFVAATPGETKKAADFFGVSYMRDGATIVHSLRTVVIGQDGKIARVFNGNDWNPEDAVSALQSSLR